MKWLYHTGDNAIEGKYFSIAKLFKTPTPTNLYKNPNMEVSELMPYELSYNRFLNDKGDIFVMSDTADIIFTNTDTKGVIQYEKYYQYNTIQCTAISNNAPIDEGDEIFPNYWFKVFSPSPTMKYLLITRHGNIVAATEQVYPMPFDAKQNDYLCFPISNDIVIGEKLTLTIYDTNLKILVTETLQSTIDNSNRVIKYQPNSLTSGVYSFTISRGDIDLLGKFVIK